MKDKKEGGATFEKVPKTTDNNWKAKAVSRQTTIRTQSKRIEELESSRDLWKSKYKVLKSSQKVEVSFCGKKAKKHQYSLLLILLLVKWQKYGRMSLRSCRHCLLELSLVLGLNIRIPSHVSIRWWVCKCGYYRVEKKPLDRLPYVVYIDESIIVGGEKVLLILGVLESEIDYQKGLEFSKMEVLFVGSSGSWKGDRITKIFGDIAQYYLLSYVVSDNGTNLKNACHGSSYTQIEDCTHCLANILKGMYKGDECFETFSKSVKSLRKNWFLSKEKSFYLPPTQRGKVRFANIFPVVNWASKQLEKWAEIPESVRKDLSFLEQNRELIAQLMSLENTVGQICEILKNGGYSLENKGKLEAILAKQKHAIFRQKVGEYLERLEEKRGILNRENIVCCSDIIESFFGKFKLKIDNNSPKRMTEFMYTIANFGKDFSEAEIKCALETIQISDLKSSKSKQK
ncbi:MAG: hypothetical protein U5M51_00905 [Emticicia sp.]|nr:hypothetical protein [Emticicia sp.]